jgi:hypothetical protein
MRFRLILCGLLLTLALGCGLFELVEPARDPAPATLADPSPTPTPIPPTATSTPVPSPTPDLCPARDDLPPPPLTDDLEATIDTLQDYLDSGGDPQQIVLSDYDVLRLGDLTGNGTQEVVFGLVDPLSPGIVPKGHVVIFACRDGGIAQLYRYEPADFNGLELIEIEDLTTDGVADLIFSEFSCGANTCWHTPFVWSWDGSDFVNRIEEPLQFPYPDFSVEDGTLMIVSGGIGSVGAGPQRPVTTTLAWTGELIEITEETTAPPTHRYHAFVDGDLAFASGDLVEAEALYERVLQDETLTAWGAMLSPEEEHDALRALAEWRTVILSVSQDDQAAAEDAYDALMASPQPLEVRAAVQILAERFWRAFQRDSDVLAACAYAVGADAAQVLEDFFFGFGYANPVYESPDLCPHLREP